MKKAMMLTLALGLAALLSPFAARADHCTEVFIFQGTDAGEARRGFNTGFVGCTADENDEALNTNVRLPGATHAIVGVFSTHSNVQGFFEYEDGEVVDLTFTSQNSRWESQSLPLRPGDITATVFTNDGEYTVTYRELD